MPLTEQIFRHGLQYHECALRCLELRAGQLFLFQPALVLLAFATATAGAGASYDLASGLSLYRAYQGEFGGGRSHNVNSGVRFEF